MTIVASPGPPAGTRQRPEQPGHPLRSALARAPIGEHGMVEAALAWRQLRPAGGPSPARAGAWSAQPAAVRSHLPIAHTDHEEVAARLARLLTGLTWAVIARAEPDGPGLLRVEVPLADHHRVARALAGTWRSACREFAAGAPARDNRGAAVALWRMAMLMHGTGSIRQAIQLRTAVPLAADLLCRAAIALGVDASTEHRPGGRAVLVCRPGDVRRLLTLTAGAG